jgi:hypothetical protein
MAEQTKKRLLVCLISEQTIPNILTILHFRPQYILFISTQSMEAKNKVNAIKKCLTNYSYHWEQDKTIIVDPNSINDCQQTLQQWEQSIDRNDYDFIINLTGGTKIMSIAVYEYFKNTDAQIIYIPIPHNYFITLSPIKCINKNKNNIDIRLKVDDYLYAYNIDIKNHELLQQNQEKALSRFNKTNYIYSNYDNLKPFLNVLYAKLKNLQSTNKQAFNRIKHKKTAKISLSISSDIVNNNVLQLFNDWALQYEEHNSNILITAEFNKDLYHYFIGGWLEEYVFNILYELKSEGITDVCLNLFLRSPKGAKNEFDVMFTYKNALYFVECKSLDQEHDKEQEILYKTGALQSDFGLNIKSFLTTQSENIYESPANTQNNQITTNQSENIVSTSQRSIKPSIQTRAKQMRTTILPLAQIDNLKEVFQKELNLKIGSSNC